MDRAGFDRWCENGILGILLAILVYGPLATGALRLEDLLVIQWLTLALTIVWILRLALSPKSPSFWPPMCWMALVFLIYAWARYATADIEYVARQECLRILVYALIFFAILDNLRRPVQGRVIGLTVIGVGLFIAFYAVIQYLSGTDQVWHFQKPSIYTQRGSGTYLNPNHMAGYLEMVLPMALAGAANRRFSILTRTLLGYAALVILMGILVSFSKGGWIACAASLSILVVWLLRTGASRWQGIALLAACLVVAFVFAVKAKMSSNRQGEMRTFLQGENIRLLLWKPAWQMFQDHSLWGVGPGHFDDRFREYRPEHQDLQARPKRVHNDYLNALVDWGLAGAVPIGLFLALFFHQILGRRIRFAQGRGGWVSPGGGEMWLVLGGTLGLVAILIHSFFDFNMHVPANAMLAITLFSLVSTHLDNAGRMRRAAGHGFFRILWGVALCAGAIYLGTQTWKATRATKAILEADSLPTNSEQQIAVLKRALGQEPRNPETAYRIGECLRLRSWQSRPGYRREAEEAIEWFEVSARLNPHDPYSLAKTGMSLDWLNRHAEAQAWYQKALEKDPNGYYINALMGWHYLQTREYEKAKEWLERSLRLYPNAKNFIASYHLGRVNEWLAEKR